MQRSNSNARTLSGSTELSFDTQNGQGERKFPDIGDGHIVSALPGSTQDWSCKKEESSRQGLPR